MGSVVNRKLGVKEMCVGHSFHSNFMSSDSFKWNQVYTVSVATYRMVSSQLLIQKIPHFLSSQLSIFTYPLNFFVENISALKFKVKLLTDKW